MKTLPSNNYRWVDTADGSQTLHSDLYGEACHSTTGAEMETKLHYIEGTKIIERQGHYPELQILEVGFGLGIGLLAVIKELGTKNHWHFVTMEIDPDLVKWFLKEHQNIPLVNNAIWINENLVVSTYEMTKLTIVVGDARKTMPNFLTENPFTFHAIFQDAFSPKRNPTLWTVEWFTLLKKYSHLDCILSTYSASSSIRKSLILAGWSVKKGHQFGPKRSSTRATIIGESDPDILTHLDRTPVGPIFDDKINEFLNQ